MLLFRLKSSYVKTFESNVLWHNFILLKVEKKITNFILKCNQPFVIEAFVAF